jgi:hypothetical protein
VADQAQRYEVHPNQILCLEDAALGPGGQGLRCQRWSCRNGGPRPGDREACQDRSVDRGVGFFSERGPEDEHPGPEGEARPRPWRAFDSPPMPAARAVALGRLSNSAAGQRRRPDADAPDRRDVDRAAVPGFAATGVAIERGRRPDQPQAGAAADAPNGDRGAGAEAAYQQAALGHRIYPYLLRDMAIERPNEVWTADITYSARWGAAFPI